MISATNVVGRGLKNPGPGNWAILPPPGMGAFDKVVITKADPNKDMAGFARFTWGCSNYHRLAFSSDKLEIMERNALPVVIMELIKVDPADDWTLDVYNVAGGNYVEGAVGVGTVINVPPAPKKPCGCGGNKNNALPPQNAGIIEGEVVIGTA